MNLEDLLQRAQVWRGGQLPPPSGNPSGFSQLDALLNGGWPQGALIEILSRYRGIGALQLLLPILARVTQQNRWLVFVAPPYLPYAPAFAQAGVQLAQTVQIHPPSRTDMLWAMEQALRSGACGAVLGWLQRVEGKDLRRLQLAAETGDCLGFLFRPEACARDSSPAAVRLQLTPVAGLPAGLAVNVLKRRGGWPIGPVVLEMKHAVAGFALSQSGD